MFKQNNLARLGKTKKNVTQVFAVQVIVAFFSLFTNVVIGRFFGKEILGIYSYFLSLTGFMILFSLPGVKHSIARLVSEDNNFLVSIRRKSLLVGFGLGAFVFAVFYTITSLLNLNPGLDLFFLYVGLYLLVNIFCSVNRNLLRGLKRLTISSLHALVGRFSILIFVLLAVVLFREPWVVFASVILGFVVQVIVQEFSLSKNVPKHARQISWAKFRKSLLLFFFVNVSTVGIYAIDRLSIRFVTDFSNLGQFEAFSNLINIIRMLAFVLPYVLIPMAVNSKYQINKSFFTILAFLLPFALTIGALSVVFVPELYGPELALPFN